MANTDRAARERSTGRRGSGGQRVLAAWVMVVVAVVGTRAARAEDERAKLIAVDGVQRSELPLVQAAMQVEVRGPIAQVRLTQRFANPLDHAIEAVYVFPLHQDGAVGAMTMRIGARTIKAEIRERAAARQLYEEARATGRTAALLEQERPNVFTQSVTGIQPGEAIDVELIYDVLLEPVDDLYELALPTVVGPRYIPGAPTGAAPAGTGVAADTARVPDASRISPPVAPPGVTTGNVFTLDIDLDAGLPVTFIDSPTHEVVLSEPSPEHFRIALADLDAVATKDVVLRWRVAATDPTLAVLADKRDALGHIALIVQPPRLAARDPSPRELVFVVDTSGSMEGEPLAIARQAMRFALKQMRPDDHFRILNFSSSVSGFAGGARVVASRDQVQRALSFVNGMRSEGGTEMLSGIRAALADPPPDGRTRYVCFMTDGYIGNEIEILAAIRKERPAGTHLFSFGVGSSVNRYLLDEMARQGQGVSQVLLLDDPPQPQIERFYQQLEAPAWTDVHVEWDGLEVLDGTPRALPALFAGAPIVVAARYRRGGRGLVRIRALAGGSAMELEQAIELPDAGGDGAVLGRLWARRRIRELQERLLSGPDAAVTKEITAIGLGHALVTPYTSFVAVDQRPRGDGTVETLAVPVALPDGVAVGGVSYSESSWVVEGASTYETIVISDSPPMIDPTSTQQGITISDTHTHEADDYIPGALGHLGGPRGGSGRARGELGAAWLGDLDGGLAGELRFGVGLLGARGLELGAGARLRLARDDRAVMTFLLSLAQWSIVRDLGLRLGAGWSYDRDALGAAWRAELTFPIRALAGERALPVATFGLGRTTAGDDHTDVGLGLGLRF